MEDLDDVTLAGGWKYLCSAVFLSAVQTVRGARLRGPAARAPERRRRESMAEIEEAWAWVEGGRGEITFEDCCESLGVNPERARRRLIKGPQA